MIDNLRGIVTRERQADRQITDADLPDRPRVKHVAAWLGVHANTIYGLIRKGEIPCKIVGKRTYTFEKDALLRWHRPDGAEEIEAIMIKAKESEEREVERRALIADLALALLKWARPEDAA